MIYYDLIDIMLAWSWREKLHWPAAGADPNNSKHNNDNNSNSNNSNGNTKT